MRWQLYFRVYGLTYVMLVIHHLCPFVKHEIAQHADELKKNVIPSGATVESRDLRIGIRTVQNQMRRFFDSPAARSE